ncbi:amidase-like protein [Bisporella sp. PMI_857]|nr:amidase-like protein [Bisporella sp. PMI_857]
MLDIQLPSGLHPATLVVIDEKLSIDAVKAALHRFETMDDVFDRNFLRLVVFSCYPDAPCELSEQLLSFLGSIGSLRVSLINRASARRDSLSEGPYFASSQGLYPVWKLVPDTQGAFVVSLVETSQGRLTHLNASCPDAAPNLAIAIPSRLYYPPRSDKPLNGLRVAIKDNIDVSGAKTTGSCRAYAQLYDVCSHCAPSTQRLLDLGAVIVGKTEMSQFADAEDPTGDFVDFHAPRNPRGDGSRGAGGSSFGSGAAVAAYDWLDFALGTDTGCSVRQPAAHQAVFGIRPSRGAMSLEGTLVIHRDLDAIGILSKDLQLLRVVSEHFYNFSAMGMEAFNSRQPATLLYPTHLFPVDDPAAQRLYNAVVEALEELLGVQRKIIDYNQLWKQHQTFTKEAFEDYFTPVFYDYIVWGQFHERAKFREDYKAKFSRDPYVNPLSQYRWELGAAMTKDHFDMMQTKREQFQEFIESIYGDNSIMVTSFKFGEPDALDIYRPTPRDRDQAEFGWGLRPAFQAPLAGQPEVVFPVGQLPTISSISGVEEMYGVVASLIGSKGMDLDIVELAANVLESLNLPQAVLTGRSPYIV